MRRAKEEAQLAARESTMEWKCVHVDPGSLTIARLLSCDERAAQHINKARCVPVLLLLPVSNARIVGTVPRLSRAKTMSNANRKVSETVYWEWHVSHY